MVMRTVSRNCALHSVGSLVALVGTCRSTEAMQHGDDAQICSSRTRMRSMGSTSGAMGRPSTGS